jgi:hypothetical protein
MGKEQDVLSDTWLGPSNPFNAIFKSVQLLCYAIESRKAKERRQDDLRHIDLAVDTLDLLRRLTQHRFLESREHQRNNDSWRWEDS